MIPAYCPRCGGGARDAEPVKPDTHPKEGDIAVCLYCGGINIYRADRTLRLPTFRERTDALKQLERMADDVQAAMRTARGDA